MPCDLTNANVNWPNTKQSRRTDILTGTSIDDRFDPYPTAAKRRAVSPSVSYLRDSHSSTSSPITRGNSSRHPIALPITIPQSTASSAASSPTIGSYPTFPRGLNITSSPTLRATLTMASPILRPLGGRRWLGEDDEREIQGAGEAVNGLTLEYARCFFNSFWLTII